MPQYVKPEIISIKGHPIYNEKWLQQRIVEDPSILGLGELEWRDSERPQPSGGRLDLLLFEPEANRRYEVELQTGESDESHIIRTIEYWDTERKRYPQYDHCAVIVAEDITSRFLNVISLFNGHIPIIAMQVKAIKVGDTISLFFTKIFDQLTLGTKEEDESRTVDREYWEKKASKASLSLTDKMMAITNKTVNEKYSLKYNMHYIGVAKDGIAQNFVTFVPKKKTVRMAFRLDKTNEIDKLLDKTDLEVLAYDRQFNYYQIKLIEKEVKENKDILIKLIKKAFESYNA